jgi:threonine dehydrogenase-like Zn-dependent dehydrogenase
MKALVHTQPNEVTYRDEPDPRPAPGEVLIRVDAVGICGSDMHAYHGKDPRRNPPLIRDLHDGTAAAAKILLRPR